MRESRTLGNTSADSSRELERQEGSEELTPHPNPLPGEEGRKTFVWLESLDRLFAKRMPRSKAAGPTPGRLDKAKEVR